MMRYSYNRNREGLVFAQRYNINASYKDLVAVCDAVRYLKARNAFDVLDGVMAQKKAIAYKRFSKHMGARHELGGRKGGYPVKAANEVRLALLNAIGNAKGKGLDGEDMFIVHSSANKTRIERRYPSKGSITWGRGMYGRGAMNHSDIEYAKVEIGLASGDEPVLSGNMKYFIKNRNVQAKEKKREAHKTAVKGKVPEKAKA